MSQTRFYCLPTVFSLSDHGCNVSLDSKENTMSQNSKSRKPRSRRSMLSGASYVLLPCLLLAAGASSAHAADWYVNRSGSDANAGASLLQPFATMQKGINSASDGDNVFVAADTYSGTGNVNLNFNGKHITLEALPLFRSPRNVTIDCKGTARGFSFTNGENASSVVDAFSVVNGKTADFGGAVYINASSPVFIDCSFSKNTALYGGAVYTYSSAPIFNNCSFTNNTATEGGAVYSDDSSAGIYSYNRFSYNHSADNGGAVYAYNGTDTFSNGTFYKNVGDNEGGAVFFDANSRTLLVNSFFTSNKGSYGGAFFAYTNASPAFYNAVIANNSAVNDGGAYVAYNYANVSLYSSTITNNTSADIGGAIYDGLYATSTLTYCIVWNDTAVIAGTNEIYNEDTSSANVTYSDVSGGYAGTGNTAVDPLFKSATDFHLQPASPVIDYVAATGSTPYDKDHFPRVSNLLLDLGAYERHLPTAVADAYSTTQNITLKVSAAKGVLANDLANRGYGLKAVLNTTTAFGTLTLKSDGAFTYVPTGVGSYTDTFTYHATNSYGSSSPVTVTITVN